MALIQAPPYPARVSRPVDAISQIFAQAVILTTAATCNIPVGSAITFGTPSAATPIFTMPISGQSTATVVGGTTLAVRTSTAANLTTLPNTSVVMGANIPAGTTVCGTNLAGGVITLCNPIGVAVTPFNNAALYAGWSIYLTDVTGVYQGMQVAGTGGKRGGVCRIR